jgi:arylsulfatase A
VLLIISDDQGYGDFAFNGNRLVRTPVLDRLASESAVFRNFVVAPACSPTRAAIWTGRDHLLTGVWGVPPRANLRPDEVRMPAFFKAVGYRTLHVGKLDCAKMGPDGPSAFGWTEWLGGGGYEHRDPMLFQTGNNRRGKGWTVDLWTDEVIRFIRDRREGPWFVSLAYIIPHLPWVCDETYSAPFTAQGCSSNLAACYGAIAQMDAAIGRLLEALRESGQAERTIVAFVSDNGATGPEAKQGTADGVVRGTDWDRRNVAGLRGHKATVWENGIRVPFLVRWPGRIASGARRQFGCAEDVLPTLLEMAGIRDVAAGRAGQTGVPAPRITGTSLGPALRDAAAVVDHPPAFRMAIAGSGSPRNGIADPQMRRFEDHHLALRGPRFKYHAIPGGGSALYDLDADPGESMDVQAKHADVAAAMARECRARWDAVMASGRAFAPPGDVADRLPKPAAKEEEENDS